MDDAQVLGVPEPEEAQALPLPSLPRRVFDVFFNPGPLFEALKVQPKWVGAVLLGGVLAALAGVLIPVELYEDVMRAQFLERGQEIPGDPADMARIGKMAGSIMGPIFYLLITLIVAGVSVVCFAFVFGDRGKFKQYFAATAHAFLIYAFASLAMTPVKIATGDPQFVLSPGNALRGVLPEGFFVDTLGMMDVFGIWAYAVLAVAATKIDPKRSFGSAFAIYMVLIVGFAMLGAMLT